MGHEANLVSKGAVLGDALEGVLLSFPGSFGVKDLNEAQMYASA